MNYISMLCYKSTLAPLYELLTQLSHYLTTQQSNHPITNVVLQIYISPAFCDVPIFLHTARANNRIPTIYPRNVLQNTTIPISLTPALLHSTPTGVAFLRSTKSINPYKSTFKESNK